MRKAFGKQIKTIENKGEKEVKVLEDSKTKELKKFEEKSNDNEKPRIPKIFLTRILEKE